MARTVSYGMGQYRFTKNYDYITELLDATGSDSVNNNIIKYQKTGNASSGWYKDILVELPTVGDNKIPVVQYGQTYFLKLSVPQNRQYTITLNLKLCPANTSDQPVLDRFQQIGRIEIPPTPEDDNIYSEVILYQIPNSTTITVGLIDAEHDETEEEHSQHVKNNVYKKKNSSSGKIEYWYYTSATAKKEVTKYNAARLIRSWEIVEGEKHIVTYKLAFSPKYNLAEGYRYLLIETDRNNLWSNEIQYVDESGDPYNGTYLDLPSVSVSLYSVNNLLAGGSSGTSQIKSGTNTLNHIGVWGHPEQIITINGEEIKIGPSGFYEIKDYDITSLGMVVEDADVDRFTIDYEYKVAR